METEKEDQYLGEFRVANRRYAGMVTLKGEKSSLELYSDKPIHIPEARMRSIRGVARTGESITICDAIGVEAGGTRLYYRTTRHSISLFPHYVAIGPRHLPADAKVVSEIIFTTTGAMGLFYDLGTFGSSQIKNVRRLMPAWAKKDRRPIKRSELFYWIDRGPIFSTKIKNITFEAFNGVSWRFPSPRGISLTNEVRIKLAFRRPVKLHEAIQQIYEFRAFCEILTQSKHCIRTIAIRHRKTGDRETYIKLYPAYEETDPGRETDFRDNLVSAGLNKSEFERVFAGWMRHQDVRRDARFRIVAGLRQDSYTVDRLVGAANAFDLLPDGIFKKPSIPKGVLKALSALSSAAKKLKEPYRGQVLSNLNRVKGLALRKKIESRFKSLPPQLKKRLPEMPLLIDHCVGTRNYFVHGSKPKLTVAAIDDLMILFTDTLEFIFVMSELNSCGWSYSRWIKQLVGRGRFKRYLVSYNEAIQRLKTASLAGQEIL